MPSDLEYLDKLPDQAILSDPQISALAGFSVCTLWRLRKLGEGPPRVQLSKRRHGSTWGAVKAWLKSREQTAA